MMHGQLNKMQGCLSGSDVAYEKVAMIAIIATLFCFYAIERYEIVPK